MKKQLTDREKAHRLADRINEAYLPEVLDMLWSYAGKSESDGKEEQRGSNKKGAALAAAPFCINEEWYSSARRAASSKQTGAPERS